MERQSCLVKGCFATFETGSAQEHDIRHCNRTGPDGGHVHRWDGQRWQAVVGELQHDRT